MSECILADYERFQEIASKVEAHWDKVREGHEVRPLHVTIDEAMDLVFLVKYFSTLLCLIREGSTFEDAEKAVRDAVNAMIENGELA